MVGSVQLQTFRRAPCLDALCCVPLLQSLQARALTCVFCKYFVLPFGFIMKLIVVVLLQGVHKHLSAAFGLEEHVAMFIVFMVCMLGTAFGIIACALFAGSDKQKAKRA